MFSSIYVACYPFICHIYSSFLPWLENITHLDGKVQNANYLWLQRNISRGEVKDREASSRNAKGKGLLLRPILIKLSFIIMSNHLYLNWKILQFKKKNWSSQSKGKPSIGTLGSIIYTMDGTTGQRHLDSSVSSTTINC